MKSSKASVIVSGIALASGAGLAVVSVIRSSYRKVSFSIARAARRMARTSSVSLSRNHRAFLMFCTLADGSIGKVTGRRRDLRARWNAFDEPFESLARMSSQIEPGTSEIESNLADSGCGIRFIVPKLHKIPAL
jgi:hypothetical protein